MTRFARIPFRLTLLLALLATVGCGGSIDAPVRDGVAAFPDDPGAPTWPRWGGPRGNFEVDVDGLAAAWAADGPPLLWSRPLGPGYSAVVADRGALFTMYRDGDDDVAVAMRAADGATIWEHRYAAPAREGNVTDFGTGPHATPLVVGDLVVTLGYTGRLSGLDVRSGEPRWSHELVDDLGGEIQQFGYSASPILHDGLVVVLVGGPHAVTAFEPSDGSIAWRSGPGSVSYATPTVIEVDGTTQIVYFSDSRIHAIDDRGERELWSHEVVNEYFNNATDATWDGDLLWAATQRDGGTRALRPVRDGDGWRADQLWFNRTIDLHYWNTLRLGAHVYASIGSNGTILAAIEMATGEIVWRERGFTQANFVHAGERSILLDAEGELALVTLRPEGLEIHAQVTIAGGPTWTPPTLLGTTLVMRDTKAIRAFDLGRAAAS